MSGLITVSVVVPIYRGEQTIAGLVAELEQYTSPTTTPDGHRFVVSDVVLVHDHGPDRSDLVLSELEQRFDFVNVVWLSRNYGQDAATIAGMVASKAEWIITMDEDGQHDPAYIATFLDTALRERVSLVFSNPTNRPPHGFMRNFTSRAAKRTLSVMCGLPQSVEFQSFRLIRGDIGRQLAKVTASGVYLDVALTWVVGRTATAPVVLRAEGREVSGYNYKSLFALFWKMFLSSGTRGLRFVSALGMLLALSGLLIAAYVTVSTIFGGEDEPGWASTIVLQLVCSGAVLFSIGIVAEYLGVALHVLIGRPLYLTVESPVTGTTAHRNEAVAAVGPVEQ
ncbi:glycosyltransferase [Smaragdicoccus niigatensis]|uniref:glycosyltransferase n=1 Tax=Smaragdicoccus niigatensis TaxID=359359 RepID=UPI00037657A3|nr:glycosyltransferase [Smaragdicoccus niigatensis]